MSGRPGLYMHVVPVWQSAWDEKRSPSEEAFDLAVLKIAPPSEGYKGGVSHSTNRLLWRSLQNDGCCHLWLPAR